MSGAGIHLITIRVDDAEIAAVFNRVAAAAKDLRPLLDRMGAPMVTSTQRRFETETDPSGRKWQRHARRTAKRRGAGAPVLRETVRLYNSLTFNTGPDYLEWGTDVPYGPTHQFGDTIQQYARSQQHYLNYNKQTGELGTRFVKKSKSNFARYATIGAYTITIPARPYLGIDAEDRQRWLDEGEAYLREAAEGGAA